MELVEQAEHVGGRHRVQVAGGLVGQDELGLGDQRPGHGDPLLLAAGELTGLVLGAVAEIDLVERGQRPLRRSWGGIPAYTSGSSTLRHAVR